MMSRMSTRKGAGLAAQRLHPLQADRYLRHRPGGRRRHIAAECRRTGLVGRSAGRAGDSRRVAAAGARRHANYFDDQRGGRGGNRAQGGDAGGRRRRRSSGWRGRHGLRLAGKIGVTVGTSGVVFAPLSSYAYEPEGRLHAFCHAVPETWHFMGVMLSAAGSLQWYKDTVAPDLDFDSLLAEAASARRQRRAVLPALSHRRAHAASRSAGAGRLHRHDEPPQPRAHDARRLEGVAFGLKDSFTLIDQAGLPERV